MEQRSIYSIGHSNHTLEAFLSLLAAHHIEVLIDTRSHPYSKFAPQFNSQALKAAVSAQRIKYGAYGNALGGRPDGDAFYDDEGFVLYGKVAESSLFLESIARLEKGIENKRVALLCSEEDPTACHRRLLVSRVLVERGIQIHHIRGDGTVQTEEELAAQLHKADKQPSLFDDEEPPAWKSIRSVLQRRTQRASSEP